MKEKGRLYRDWEWFGLLPYSLIKGLPEDLWHNGLHGRHRNTSDISERYRVRLRRTFHSLNAQPHQDIFLSQLANYKGKLPLLIINGTAKIRHLTDESGLKLAQEVFEMTPNAFGSDGVGRYAYENTQILEGNDTVGRYLGEIDFARSPSLSLAVSLSGAAYDSTLAGNGLLRNFISVLGFDLGRHIRNPRVNPDVRKKYEGTILLYRLLYPKENGTGPNGTNFQIADGGHAENLGAFSLIRRLCQHIVIVDGGHDPSFEFDDYSRLKARLLHDTKGQVELVVKDIDIVTEQTKAIRKKYENDLWDQDKDSKLVRDLEIRAAELRSRFGIKPVMEGHVNLPAESDVPGKRLGITYLKLGYPDLPASACDAILEKARPLNLGQNSSMNDLKYFKGDLVELYYCLIKQYTQWNLYNKIIGRTAFPHQSTFDLNLSPLQVHAYLELGARIANKIMREELGLR